MSPEISPRPKRVMLSTPDGIVVVGVHSARELYDINLKDAYFQLGRVIDDLPPLLPSHTKAQEGWRRKQRHHLNRNGDESIFDLLPESLAKSTKPLTRVTNTLLRNDIATKKDLIKHPLAEINEMRGIGEKSMILIEAMRNVALAQLWAKHSD